MINIFMNQKIPKSKTGIIRYCRLILDLDLETEILQCHLDKLTRIIHDHLYNDNMSPKDIASKYGIVHSDFGMFIKTSLGIKLKPLKEAINNFYHNEGRQVTDEKKVYYAACRFLFDPYMYDFLPGYNLLLEKGIYHPTENTQGAVRDHILSKAYGWANSIDPIVISHPANCQFITNLENVQKSSDSHISLDALQTRIANFSSNLPEYTAYTIKTSMTSQHKSRISESLRKFHRENKRIRITDGHNNQMHPANQPIPVGFRRGLTRLK